MKYSKQIFLIACLAVSLGSVAQTPVAQPSYPTAGVPTEPNFSSDLALPKVDAPSPFAPHQGAVTPQQMYSPATTGGSYNARELQRGSSSQVISVGGGAGAAGSAGGVVSASLGNSDPAVAAISINPMAVRKHRDFVSADEFLLDGEDNATISKRRLGGWWPDLDDGEMNDSDQMGAPITDTPWLFLLLACAAFVGVRRRRRSGEWLGR